MLWFRPQPAILISWENRTMIVKKNVWDLLAPVYDLFVKPNRKAYSEMTAMIRRAVKDKEVLELASGTAVISKGIARVTKRTVATDISDNMLGQARKGYVPQQLEIMYADASFLPFDDASFDVVVIANALHIIAAPEQVLGEIKRVLRPGGMLIAPNFIHGEVKGNREIPQKLLVAAGVRFMREWDAESYERFLAANGFKITGKCVLSAVFPLMYAECVPEDSTSLPDYDLFDRLPEEAQYKNWIPTGMVNSLCIATGALAAGSAFVTLAARRKQTFPRSAASFLLGAGTAAVGIAAIWSVYAREQFSYNGERKLSRQIVEGTAKFIDIPDGGVGLDVGCGSGALTIACAKRNPGAKVIGIDRWGMEYASFSKSLCEKNAECEGAANTEFRDGNAVKLDFPDESFDAVMSNYVYHNISGVNKQKLLLETLRVLKKGGTFAIHDIMLSARFGDMTAFARKLKDMGYEKVELIDTTDGFFMSEKEAFLLMLKGSVLLVGKK